MHRPRNSWSSPYANGSNQTSSSSRQVGCGSPRVWRSTSWRWSSASWSSGRSSSSVTSRGCDRSGSRVTRTWRLQYERVRSTPARNCATPCGRTCATSSRWLTRSTCPARAEQLNRLPGGELAAGGVDVGAAVASHGRVDTELFQQIAKGMHSLRGRTPGEVTRRRVERDEVDVRGERQGTAQRGELARI